MTNLDLLKPIRMFGYFFIMIGAAGLLIHFLALGDVRYTAGFKAFVLVVSFLHILVGSGVILRRIWGFYALKLYLYSLYLAIPIGTYVAIKTFKYIRTYNIEQYFK